MSRPSRDRVRFNVGPNALAKSGMADLLQEVFGISSSELCAHKDYCDGITIVCRPQPIDASGRPNEVRL